MDDWTTAGWGTASYFEITWLLLTCMTFVASAAALYLAVGDYKAVRQAKKNSLVEAVAKDSITVCSMRLLVIIALGLFAIRMALLPPVSTEVYRIILFIAVATVYTSLAVILGSYFKTRSYVLHEIHRRDNAH